MCSRFIISTAKGSSVPARTRLKTLQVFDQNALVFFALKKVGRRPEHSVCKVGKVFEPISSW